MVKKEKSLDVAVLEDADRTVHAFDTLPADRTVTLFHSLAGALTDALRGVDERNRDAVARLSTILMRIEGDAHREGRIKLLAEACFYLTRIGRAYDGMPLGRHAQHLAVTHGLKDLERLAAMALGAAYLDGACFEDACRTLERALVLSREIGDAELECGALTNTAALLKEMGLYQEAMEVSDKVLACDLHSPRGRWMALGNAIHGLFSAHRRHDHEAALRYLRVGSDALDDNPLSDVMQKTTFEFYRAMYLISANDHETAEALIDAARCRAEGVANPRVHVLLDVASALCDWASREPVRERRARKSLAELHHRTKTSRIHHDDVLRALVEVHKRTFTGELDHGAQGDDGGVGLDGLSRLVMKTAHTGIGYAKELVEFNTGPRPRPCDAAASTAYVAGVKNAKFYRQMSDRGVARRQDSSSEQPPYDPLAGAKAWLADESASPPAVIADIGNPGVVGRSPIEPKVVRAHGELAAIHGDMAQLRVQSLKATMRTAAYDVAENWALTAEFFDDQTGEHCFRVGRLAGLLAAEIGIDTENCLRIEHAARLHDIGKIAVNEMILLKPGPLDSNEIVAMRAHTEVGAQLLEHAEDPTLQMAAAIAKYHHAWWNGAGYPNASGENIPLAARICAFADVYDALTNERPYKRPWPHKLAVEQMLCESGAHFDPRLMQPFLRVLERYVGSNAAMPANRLHLTDMEANGLLVSRRSLMETVKSS